MATRPHICVFCGSSFGASRTFREHAARIGSEIARRGAGMVYGGGRVGLMGVAADAALAGGGRVVGVIPDPLATLEIAHHGVTELHVVPDMHQRKARMSERSSAFLTMPGGVGTYEEFFEILSWSALGIHRKPVGLLNVEGYFDPLLALLEHGAEQGFIRPEHLAPLITSDDPENLVGALLAYQPPPGVARQTKLNEA